MGISITLIIIIATVIISIGAFNNQRLMDDLIFYPPAVTQRNQYYRFITCGFIHADFTHLLFNMFSLYIFGEFVEKSFQVLFGNNGRILYLAMYVLALPICMLPSYFRNRHNYHYRSLGASGAVSAVMFAGMLLVPTVKIGFFFLPPIIPAFIFAPAYLIITAVMDKKGTGNINHSAHLWGAIFGLAFMAITAKWLANFDVISNCINEVRIFLHLN